jgi:hypothetical protein
VKGLVPDTSPELILSKNYGVVWAMLYWPLRAKDKNIKNIKPHRSGKGHGVILLECPNYKTTPSGVAKNIPNSPYLSAIHPRAKLIKLIAVDDFFTCFCVLILNAGCRFGFACGSLLSSRGFVNLQRL